MTATNEIQHPEPLAEGETLGEFVRDPEGVSLDEWARVLRYGVPTGFLRRVRMKTVGEVSRELAARLDVQVCGKCGHVRQRPPCTYGGPHKKCGGEFSDRIDEYFSIIEGGEARRECPRDVHRVACYATTGGSEGHRVWVEVIPFGERGPEPAVRLFGIKTFKGMAYARELANICADLLGA